MNEQYAYIAIGDGGLAVVEIADPTTPMIVGIVDTPGDAQGVAVSGEYAYVADGLLGLQVVDISKPTSPAIVGSVAIPGDALSIAAAGEYAYVGGSKVAVVDISNPLEPAIVGDANVAAFSIAVGANHAYAGSWPFVNVIDISNPSDPAIVGQTPTPTGARDMALAGSHLYVACDISGLEVFDVTNPVMPSAEGGLSLCFPYGLARGVAVDDRYVYVIQTISGKPAGTNALESCGFWVLYLQCETTTAVEPSLPDAAPARGIRLAQSHPNPFSTASRFTEIGFDLAAGSRATVSLFDSSGRLVRRLLDEPLDAGSHAAVWDGRNEVGNPVGSGIYFYRLEAGGSSATHSLVRLR